MAEAGFSETHYHPATAIMILIQGIKWLLTGRTHTGIFLMTVMHTEVTGAKGAELLFVTITDLEA
jgi:hypothetical protein